MQIGIQDIWGSDYRQGFTVVFLGEKYSKMFFAIIFFVAIGIIVKYLSTCLEKTNPYLTY